jgi:hypothetical protein
VSRFVIPSVLTVLVLAAGLNACSLGAQEPDNKALRVFEDFSNGIDAWREQRLDQRSTEYRVVEVGGNAALQALSDNAAAALLLSIEPSLAPTVTVRWRWRVGGSLTGNSLETQREGDDYAARLFVIFGDAELDSDTRALAYAWAGRQPIGSLYPNPYISEVATIVLRSGDQDAGSWVSEERDVGADYQRAFGEPSPPVAAIAVLVDTDDTGSKVVAWFDDLELLTAAPSGAAPTDP